MPLTVCQSCTKEFYVKPNRLARGWGRYCSNLCQNQGKQRGEILPCRECGKLTYKSRKDLRRSKSKTFFCGKSCQTKWRNSTLYIRQNHSNWKNGMSSYRQALIRSPIDRVCNKCKTDDHRILAVHHKDRNRMNNDLVNLTWLCHNCHYLVHHYPAEAVGFLLIPHKTGTESNYEL